MPITRRIGSPEQLTCYRDARKLSKGEQKQEALNALCVALSYGKAEVKSLSYSQQYDGREYVVISYETGGRQTIDVTGASIQSTLWAVFVKV